MTILFFLLLRDALLKVSIYNEYHIYIYTFKYMDVFFTIYTFTHVIDTDVYIYIYLQ